MSDLDDNGKEIRAFGKLPNGWHFGEGVGAAETTMADALDICALMHEKGIEEINVFPAIDGGILISAYFKNEALDVSCRPDGTMEIDYEIDDVLEDEKIGLSLNDVEAYLEDLNWSKRKLYEYCIPNILTKRNEDSQVRLFNLLVTTKGSQHLVLNVRMRSVETSVSTSPDFTRLSQDILSYSGELSPDDCRVTPFSTKNHQQRGIYVIVISRN